jgi:hypothetical protein
MPPTARASRPDPRREARAGSRAGVRRRRPLPIRTFAELGLAPRLVEVLATNGITAPFPIQNATLPDSLAGRDILGRGVTGSGKTLAFALPVAGELSLAGWMTQGQSTEGHADCRRSPRLRLRSSCLAHRAHAINIVLQLRAAWSRCDRARPAGPPPVERLFGAGGVLKLDE